MASPSELQAFEDINCTLLTTGMFSDVTLVAGEKTAVAHKSILVARSSVFAALFAELSNAENRVEIYVQADVLEHFLAFIYTGKVPDLEPKMAQNLLAAAEKYQLEQLKSITKDYLCGQSVARLLPFTEAVNATKLKCLELLNSPASPPTTPRPLPPVARLHDPCLVALFRQLPPADQITARTVCRRWADLVSYAARSTRSLAILVDDSLDIAEVRLNRLSHGRFWHLLKLLQKDDGTPLLPRHSLSQWNSLQLSSLDEETASQIMATFPVLKELQLSAVLNNGHGHLYEDDNFQCDCCTTTTPPHSIIDHIVRLLEHWRPQLTTLKLVIWSDNEAASSCYRLGLAISSLPALKHLYLDLHWNNEPHCLPLSNLPQLTHFTVNSNSDQFPNIFRQYDPLNSASVQICYDGDDCEYDSIIPQFTSLNKDLRRRFLRIDDGHPADYRTICSHFPSLTSVYLSLLNATFRDFLTSASQLTQLVHLYLEIDFEDIRPDDQPHRLLAQLKSVRSLQLEITNRQSHRDLEPLNLAWTMPNLQVIYFVIRLFKCTPCGIINGSTPNEKRKHCLRQMFAPLKRGCAQLHTIKHNREDSLGTAEEILAEPITEAASSSIDMDVSADNSTGESL